LLNPTTRLLQSAAAALLASLLLCAPAWSAAPPSWHSLGPERLTRADPPCDKTWDGGNGDWNDGTKWGPNHNAIPVDERACLPDGSYTVTLSNNTNNVAGMTVGTGVTLNVAASINSPSVSSINRGTIRIQPDGRFSGTSVANEGTIEDNGVANSDTFIGQSVVNSGMLRANASLQIRGGVTNTATGTITTLAAGTLVIINGAAVTLDGTVNNAGTFYQGGGQLTLGALTHTGAPLQIAAGLFTPKLDPSGTGTAKVDARGVIQLVGNVAAGMTVNVREVVNASQGILQLDADHTNSGKIVMETSSQLEDITVGVVSGQPRLTNAGTFEVKPGAGGNRFLKVQLTNTGTLKVAAGTVLTVNGAPNSGVYTHTSSGTIDVAATGGLNITNGVPVFTQTGGTITANGFFQQTHGTHVHQGGTVSGSIRITATGSPPPSLDPSGPGGPTFEVRTTAILAGNVHPDAKIIIRGSDAGTGTLDVVSDQTNNGTIVLDAVENDSNAAQIVSSASGTLTNKGSLDCQANGGCTLRLVTVNQGTAEIHKSTFAYRQGIVDTPAFINDGGTVDLFDTLQSQGGYRQITGTTRLNTATLYVRGAPGFIDIQAGVLSGIGTVIGPLTNGGDVRPGTLASPYGRIHVVDSNWEFGTLNAASYTQTATGALVVGVNGTTAGTNYDQLEVDGPVTLDGALEVSKGAFVPQQAPPDRFTVLKAEGRTGTFATTSGLPSGPFTLLYDTPPDAVVLQAGAPPDGPHLDIADAEVTEGDSGTKNLTFTVKLSQTVGDEVRAQWATVPDSATAPADYTTSSGEVVFAPGQTERQITVPIVGDTTPEPAESFLVRLRLPTGGADLGVARATGTILSDDLGITKVSPIVAGDYGKATLTITGGGFVTGTKVRLVRAGSVDRVGTVIGEPVDNGRLVARFELTGAEAGDWDVVVTEPAGAGGDSATAPAALKIVAAARPRIAVSVTMPSALRYGFDGLATISIRNEGTNDADIDLLRVRGTLVKLRLAPGDTPSAAPLAIAGDDLAELMGGSAVIPAGETRRVVVRYVSDSLTAHATLRVDAEVYAGGALAAANPTGVDPEDQGGHITGHVRNGAGEGVGSVPVTAVRTDGANGAGRIRTAETKPDGTYDIDGLADGDYLVGVGADPRTAGQRKAAVIDPDHRGPAADLIADVSRVGGSVRDAAGARVPESQVSLLDADGNLVDTAEADGQGGFSFAVLRSGTYSLRARTPAGGLARLTSVDVVAGLPRMGLLLATGNRHLDVTVNAGGTPVTGAWVRVRLSGDDAEETVKRTAASGVASFDGLPDGAVEVAATAADRAPDTATVSGTQHTFELGVGGKLQGLVSGPDGALGDATVIAVKQAGGARHRAYAAADGHYSLGSLAPGLYDVWMQAPGLAPKLAEGVSVSGTVTLDGTLDASGVDQPLRVISPGGGYTPGALFAIRHHATGAQLVTVFSDTEGIAHPGPLPPGLYDVEIVFPGSLPVVHPLTIGARRSARIEQAPQDFPAPPIATAPPPFRQIAARYVTPYRSLFSQLESPTLNEKDRLGFDQVTAIYPTPCPRADRLYSIIQAKKKVKTLAFSAWLDAWLVANQGTSSQVQEYLLKSGELGAKMYMTAAMIAQGGPPAGVSPTELALVNSWIGNLGNLAANEAGGQAPAPPATFDENVVKYGEKTEEVLGVMKEAHQEYFGGQETAFFKGKVKAGDAFAVADAIRDLIKFNKELEKFPDDVKQRGDGYLQTQDTYNKVILQLEDLVNAYKAAIASCPDPNDDPLPQPAPTGGGGGATDNQFSGDPNDILGPAGVGAEKWIPGQQDLGYTIRFENLGPGSVSNPDNLPLATSPAVLVTVTDQLDDDIDLDAFELGDFGWGDFDVAVPGGLQSYHADFPQADGDIVRADAALDRPSRTVTWTLTTIDPATGDLETSPSAGFLPPEDGTGNGQGYVSYGARGKKSLAHATAITAQATIVFDLNAPIQTPAHTNSVDANPPVSAVTSAVQPGVGGASCADSLSLQWSGTDSGSGVGVFDVWVDVDGSGPTLWLPATTATAASYPGASGHHYGFFTVAHDKTGLDEAPPATPDVAADIVDCDAVAPLTVPTVIGPAAIGGWFPGPVSVRLDAVDNAGGFGVSSLTWAATGAAPGGATVNTDTVTIPVNADGVTDLTFGAADSAGNAAATRALQVKVDSKAPEVILSAPVEGATVNVGAEVAARFACTDAGSGLESCTGTVSDGAPINTTSPGEKTFTAQGTDKTGHTAVVTHRYTVVAVTPEPTHTPSAAPTATPTPGPVPTIRLTAKLVKLTTEKSARFSLQNLAAFAVTGRASLLSGKKVVAKPKALSVPKLGKLTLALSLDSRTRKALKRGKTVKVTLVLELRSGTVTKTVRQAIKLKLAKKRKR
jgi:hypothetical protein